MDSPDQQPDRQTTPHDSSHTPKPDTSQHWFTKFRQRLSRVTQRLLTRLFGARHSSRPLPPPRYRPNPLLRYVYRRRHVPPGIMPRSHDTPTHHADLTVAGNQRDAPKITPTRSDDVTGPKKAIPGHSSAVGSTAGAVAPPAPATVVAIADTEAARRSVTEVDANDELPSAGDTQNAVTDYMQDEMPEVSPAVRESTVTNADLLPFSTESDNTTGHPDSFVETGLPLEEPVGDSLTVDHATLTEHSADADYPLITPRVIIAETPSPDPSLTADGLIDLTVMWRTWLSPLDERQRAVLTALYGIDGDDPLTLQEVGDEMGISRERVRQICGQALRAMRGYVHQPGSGSRLLSLFSACVQQAHHLLTVTEWEAYLDQHAVWYEAAPRPALMRLLCDWHDDYRFYERYQVACCAHIGERLEELHKTAKRIIQRHKTPLAADTLFHTLRSSLPNGAPPIMREASFLRKALTLFNDIIVMGNGTYTRRRKQVRPIAPHKGVRWLGRPGTRLHEWELKLRQQIEQVAWIGQIRLSEAEFHELCTHIQTEARGMNQFRKVPEGQPARVPAAVFVTTMVFAARYSQQDADEFWIPYLRSVWNVDLTPAFQTRCRKRFVKAVAELEQTYHLEFPRASDGDVVAPIYRHALLPHYVQDDFAAWLRDKWYHILPLADMPTLLIPAIEQDPSFATLSKRLRTFISSTNSRNTAADLIADMVAAISLHVNQGESIENIAARLAETPIKQELWAEISKAFTAADTMDSALLRVGKPRVHWVWNLDADELALRVQNLVLTRDRDWEGEPDRLVWVRSPDDDPTRADIEVAVAPLRMQTGERVIQEVLLSEPDGPLLGQLILLTDLDESVFVLSLPPQPDEPIQFFRPVKQNSIGVPVRADEVSDGTWWVCAKTSLRIVDEENDPVPPDRLLAVPYPLGTVYAWAAQVTLTLPVTLQSEDGAELSLRRESNQTQDTALQLTLEGGTPISGLAAQIQPIYTSTAITVTLTEGGTRVAKQANLWIEGQDGWRFIRSLMTMLTEGQATLVDDTLSVHLAKVLPQRPGAYTLDVRASLQPLLPTPLTFAVVPNLRIETPSLHDFYSPAHPFEVILYGLREEEVVPLTEAVVELQSDGMLHAKWEDLRTEPRLLLRFDKTEIPIGWSPPRAVAWLAPTPQHSFLTLEELRGATLHVVTHGITAQEFHLVLAQGGARRYALSRGRAAVDIGQDHLAAMLRLAGHPHNTVTIHVGPASWLLCCVRERPDLSRTRVTYDAVTATVQVDTGLRAAWPGACRILAESMSNPFAPRTLLATQESLQPQQIINVSLAPDSYRLVVELDGAPLELNETATRFEVGVVGEPDDTTEINAALVAEIRSGKVLSPERAEDFILLWAELAEEGRAELTATTLYQLATVPGFALANFLPSHLDALWPTLRALREAQDDTTWIATRGQLPAWILLPNPLIFRTLIRGYEWPVYPLTTAHGGLTGKGYGIWPLDGMKVQVFVQWYTVSGTQVRVEAGIPDQDPLYWEKVDLLDTYGVYYCPHCDRLVGEKGRFTLPDETIERHRHGRKQTDLKVLNGIDVHSDFHLIVDCLGNRRSTSLLDIYYDNNIPYPPAEVYLPVPKHYLPAFSASVRRQMDSLIRAVSRYGNNSEDASPWASAARLLSHWHDSRKVSSFGQAVTALAVLLRTAAYYPPRYKRLLQNTGLSVSAIQDLLVELDREAPAYLQWGMTWAELLMRHSPGFRIR